MAEGRESSLDDVDGDADFYGFGLEAHAVCAGLVAEFAVLISDEFQGHGLGTELLKRLIEIARADGLDRVTADILGENRQMIEICKLLGFRLEYGGDSVVKAKLDLHKTSAEADAAS